MKTIVALTLLLILLIAIELRAQSTESRSSSKDAAIADTVNTRESSQPGAARDGNDPTFRDDSTDAAMGMSGLSSTPGTSTTRGAGGLGTNQNPGHNTSSDIYNMERRDSIEKVKRKERRKKEAE